MLPLALADDRQPRRRRRSPAALAADRLALWEQALQARLPLVMLLWSAGAAALALRMMLGLLWVRRRSHPAAFAHRPRLAGAGDATGARLGIARPVRLGLVDDLPSPVTAGWWRPVVLLPASLASGMPVDLLEALLAHELAHIKRHDYLVNLIQSAIEIVLFYHPTVWWLSSRIRLEREQIADDFAASMLGEPRRLALALIRAGPFPARHHTPPCPCGTRRKSHETHQTPGPPGIRTAELEDGAADPRPGRRLRRLLRQRADRAGDAGPAARRSRKPSACRCAAAATNAYALVRPGHTAPAAAATAPTGSEIEAAKRAIPGEFLWFRHDGKAYVVRDAGVVAKVVDAWAPVDRLGDEMEGYGHEMEQHGKVMEALGRHMEHAAGTGERSGPQRRTQDGEPGHATRSGSDARWKNWAARWRTPTRAQRDSLHRQMDAAGRADARARRARWSSRRKRMRPAERMRRRMQPMEEIGRKMKEAGKPMDALGKKMDVLGKQMEAESPRRRKGDARPDQGCAGEGPGGAGAGRLTAPRRRLRCQKSMAAWTIWSERPCASLPVSLFRSAPPASAARRGPGAAPAKPADQPATSFPYTPGLDVNAMDKAPTRASTSTSTPAAAG